MSGEDRSGSATLEPPDASGQGDGPLDADASLVGRRVLHFHVVERLGGGGMGVVYKAIDEKLRRPVALKVLATRYVADDRNKAMIFREARSAAALVHPNIAAIHDVHDDGRIAFLVMELIAGETLRARVDREGAVPLERALGWTQQIARALACAHGAGIIHRDLKLENVMLTASGDVKLLDFGLAKVDAVEEPALVESGRPHEAAALAPTMHASDRATERGRVMGTPAYMSPEQAAGQPVDARADVFAFGVVLYVLLTGTSPFARSGDPASWGDASSSDWTPRAPLRKVVPRTPREVDRLVQRCLAYDREARFADGADLARAVARCAELARRGRAWRIATRAIAAVAVLGAIVGLAIVASRRREPAALGSSARAPLLVRAMRCKPAALDPPDDEVARALGTHACARLGIDLGVAWGEGTDGSALDVHVARRDDGCEATLAIGDRTTSARGSTPRAAIAAAEARLALELTSPPPSAERIVAWGAKDEASARRIERAWRRIALGLSDNREAELREAARLDPGSPWPYVMLEWISFGAAVEEARANGIARASILPQARADAVRGDLTDARSPGTRDESLRLLRRAYDEAPDDSEIAVLYSMTLTGADRVDEAGAVLERLLARAPSDGVLAARWWLQESEAYLDVDRKLRVVAALSAIFPESRAWAAPVANLVTAGRTDDARAAVAFGERLGIEGTEAVWSQLPAAYVALATGDAPRAREQARGPWSDGRLSVSQRGALLTVASYWLEGRFEDGQSIALDEIARNEAAGNGAHALKVARALLQDRRLLGAPPLDETRLAALAHDVETHGTEWRPWSVAAACEIALARWRARGAAGRREADAALDAIEARARAETAGDEKARVTMLVGTVPLVRAVRGDAAAARRWRDTAAAPFGFRREAAFDAALALEATGDRAAAEAAYRTATTPFPASFGELGSDALVMVAAHAHLAALLRARGERAEADAEDAFVAKAWARSDPGIRELMTRAR